MGSIRQIVTNRPVFTVDRSSSVREVARYMAEKNIGAVSVMEEGRFVGIFSERDVINRIVARGIDPSTTMVGMVMTTQIVVAHADDSTELCLRKMKQAGCRHLPVVEGKELIGMLSLRDLLLIDISEKDDKIEFLHSYMFHVRPAAAG